MNILNRNGWQVFTWPLWDYCRCCESCDAIDFAWPSGYAHYLWPKSEPIMESWSFWILEVRHFIEVKKCREK